MGMKIKMDVAKFKEHLRATADELGRATRPAAQAGAQVVYDRAKFKEHLRATTDELGGQRDQRRRQALKWFMTEPSKSYLPNW